MGNVIKLPNTYIPGIKFSSKQILEVTIMLLGFGISFKHIASLGWSMVGILVTIVVVTLLLTYLLSFVFKYKQSTGWLVGFGTAICGNTAIVALSSRIPGEKRDVGIAIAVINFLGLIGMFGLPLLFTGNLEENDVATLIGGTLHGVPNVAGAGYFIKDSVGELALTIKLGRVVMLAPALIVFTLLINQKAEYKKSEFRIPYYIWGFVGAIAITSFLPLDASFLEIPKTAGKIMLTIAMAAIGLNIRLVELIKVGGQSLLLGTILFIVQIGVVGLLLFLL